MSDKNDVIIGINFISQTGTIIMLTNIHLRNVDPELLRHLKLESTKEDVSMNTLILTLLRRSLNLTTQKPSKVYHDLDQLAGTWSKEQAKAFLNSISDFENVDKDIWK